MGKGIFITGTGTDVGKTYASALLVKVLREAGTKSAYYKAAVSGNCKDGNGKLIPGDAVWVKEHAGISQPLDTMVPYIYGQAVSPHLASRAEGNPVELPTVREGYHQLCRDYDYITMEGSGGILCPLCCENGKELWLEDVIKDLGLSCLVVADAGLGTINSTILTLEYLRMKHIPARGVVVNHFHPDNEMEQDNIKIIEKRGDVPVLACIPKGAREIGISPEKLMAFYQ